MMIVSLMMTGHGTMTENQVNMVNHLKDPQNIFREYYMMMIEKS